MEKIVIRGVIQFFFMEGKAAEKIHEMIASTIGGSCPSYETKILWVNEFKRGRASIRDARRPGTPKSAMTPENIDEVYDIILADKGVKVHELAQAVGISIYKVHCILHHELHMRKLKIGTITISNCCLSHPSKLHIEPHS